MAPQVRDLQALIAEQSKAIAPQQALIDQSIVDNTNAGASQEAGLGAQKEQSFKNIEQTASNKGMFFSGFSPDEEAKYTAGTYLPALAQLQATIAQTRSNLLGKKADLNTDVFKTATGMRESDISAKNSWDSQQQQQAFQASEAEKQRQFTAAQNAAERAANVAAASARASSPSAAASKQGAAATLAQALKGVAGRDGFVSPQSFAAARTEWTSAGYSFSDFNNYFRNFANLTYGPTSLKNYGLK